MKRIGIMLASFVLPAVALAQSGVNTSYIDGIFVAAQRLLNTALPIIIAAAVVWFIVVVFQYALSTDEEKKKAAKGHIIWGIVGLVVMVSVWGLVNIVAGVVGLTPGQGAPNIPTLPAGR